jgi:hypothetical protein
LDDVRERVTAVQRQAETPTITLVASLRPDQWGHIEAKLKKGNDQWQREWASQTTAERLERRVKSNTERAEEFYGRLEDRQLQALRDSLSASNFNPQASYAERLRRQQDLLLTFKAMQGKAGSVEALATLRDYEARLLKSPTPGYQAYADRFTQESCTSFAALHNSTTPEQRQRAIRRLAAYQRDALELAGRK